MSKTVGRTFPIALVGMALVGLAMMATACGNANENALEQLIEQQTGEGVDIDFEDGGGFNVQTDEGSFTLDEDGNFTVIGDDGEVITGDIDADDNSINVQSDDGNIVLQGDGETGSVEITDGDGTAVFQSSQGIPDEWPSDVPQPIGLTILTGSTFSDATTSAVTVIGTTQVSPSEFVVAYGAFLESAGFTQTTIIEGDGNALGFYEGPVWVVAVNGAADGGVTTVSIGVSPFDN